MYSRQVITMNTLIFAVLASLGALANAGAIGHGHGVVVAGPSGIVTPHGAIGPAGHGHGLGLGLGYGAGLGLGHGAGLGLGHGAVIAAPVAHSYVAGPAVGYGLGYGHGAVGYGVGHGLGHGLGHGIAVQGPHTVPAVIAGPAGKIVAHGLYGVPHHGHHGW